MLVLSNEQNTTGDAQQSNNALGEVEYQIDLFLDNNCKSSFKMDKYLTQLDFKKKLVLIMRESFNPLLEEITR